MEVKLSLNYCEKFHYQRSKLRLWENKIAFYRFVFTQFCGLNHGDFVNELLKLYDGCEKNHFQNFKVWYDIH